jgi:hypothetical protein
MDRTGRCKALWPVAKCFVVNVAGDLRICTTLRVYIALIRLIGSRLSKLAYCAGSNREMYGP